MKTIETRCKWIVISALVLLAGGQGLAQVQVPLAEVGTASYAMTICSGVFVSGRNVEEIRTQDLAPNAGVPFAAEIDYEERSVAATISGMYSRKAIYREGLGCIVSLGSSEQVLRTQKATLPPLPEDPKKVAWPSGDLNAVEKHAVGIDYGQLDKAVATAFSEPVPDKPRWTRAVVVIHNGRIIAERYAPGITQDTPLIGWSMTKSVTSALAGILVDQGKLSLHSRAPVADWEKVDDPRREITLGHLLHMSSGLEFDGEPYPGVSDNYEMLFRQQDMASYAINKPLKAEPGTLWEYSTGTAGIISRIIQRTLGEEANLMFPRRALFNPLGMRSAVMYPDATGTFVGGAYMYASARDWGRFGLLFLQKGTWEGKRVLSEDWIDYVQKHARTFRDEGDEGGGYGAQFWLNSSIEPHGKLKWPGVPGDAYSCGGRGGQSVVIIPSRDLVVVRLGMTHAELGAEWNEGKFLTDILKAIPGGDVSKPAEGDTERTMATNAPSPVKSGGVPSTEKGLYVNKAHEFTVRYDEATINIDLPLIPPQVVRKKAATELPLLAIYVDDIPKGVVLADTESFMEEFYKKLPDITGLKVSNKEMIRLSDGTEANFFEMKWMSGPYPMQTVCVFAYKRGKMIGVTVASIEGTPAGYLKGMVTSLRFFGNEEENRAPLQAPGGIERILDSGKIIGFTDKNNSHAWFGVPYAKPPVGDLRWKAPRPADPWTEPMQATRVGNMCTQYQSALTAPAGGDGDRFSGQEDCLYLNIWSPPFTAEDLPEGDKRLPVMVWIHGGGNSIGHGGSNSGAMLATTYDLIVLTINYRLGPMGWFSHPALRDAGTGDEDSSGNYGTLDMIHALKWVRQNISRFGGDPGNVTVFGESAGGTDVLSLMISPKARGLFHRAIVQSGGIWINPRAEAENYSDDAVPGHASSSREAVNKLLISDGLAADRREAKAYQNRMDKKAIASYLRGKSVAEVLSVYGHRIMGMIDAPELIADGAVLPAGPTEELLADKSRYNAVPVILGSNRDEEKLFMASDPKYVTRTPEGRTLLKDRAVYDRDARYLSDMQKAGRVDRLSSILRASQGPSVFAYRFDWDEERSYPGSSDLKVTLGAAHSLEIQFVFNDFEQGSLIPVPIYQESKLAGRDALAGSMSSYWAEFAYTGNPGRGRSGSEVLWKPWANDGLDTDTYIIFDTPEDRGIRMAKDRITVTDIKKRLKADTSFTKQEEHCRMYVSLFRWDGNFDELEYKNLGEEGCSAFAPETFFGW